MVGKIKQKECGSRHPIAIIGTGPVGLLAALNLAPYHGKIVLIGPQTSLEDGRTSALMMPAIGQLQQLGLWEQMQADAAALIRLRIIDATSRLVRAPTLTFHASEISEAAFGYNIPNRVLNTVLRKSVETTTNIIWHKCRVNHYQHESTHVTLVLDDETRHEVSLVIAADGRNSPARVAAGITAYQWRYPQMALVLNFTHQLSHQNCSNEFHTEHGPFTQVPLPGRRSSLVWVCNPLEAKRLSGVGREALATEIEKQMGSMLGKITLDGPQDWPAQSWPLGGLILNRFGAHRTLLMGEAAHVFPPIGAQGLNLGFRDIADLLSILRNKSQNTDDASIIDDYNHHRRADIWLRTGCVHALNRTLLANFLPAQIIRSAGLEALRKWSPLRAWLMREGLTPGSGLHALLPRRRSFRKAADIAN